MDCLRFAMQHKWEDEFEKIYMSGIAASEGKLEMLQYLHQLNGDHSFSVLTSAAHGGSLECLLYCYEHDKKSKLYAKLNEDNTQAVSQAICTGRWDISVDSNSDTQSRLKCLQYLPPTRALLRAQANYSACSTCTRMAADSPPASPLLL